MNPQRLDAWAVFWSGPIAWFLQQFVLFQLTLPSCHDKPWLASAVGALFLLIPAAAIIFAGRALLGPGATMTDIPLRRFILMTGGLAAVIFLIAMLWQEAATLVYSGCER
jgi:hypothetical protein